MTGKGSGQEQTRRAEVGILIYPGCQQGAVFGLSDLLWIANEHAARHGAEAIRVSFWEAQNDGQVVRTRDSHPECGDAVPAVLIAPPRLDHPADAEQTAPYARWLLDRHAAGSVLASVCAGAFLVAATGLLSGRPATTHWYFEEAFRTRFPDVKLDINRLIIDDGDIITAGGITAWMELGLRIVDRLLGPSIMMETARFMLVDPAGREQQHYSSFSPRLTHGDEAILRVQHWLQAKGAVHVSVRDMAAEAHMEERTFLRRFRAATGLKPLEYSQHLRVGKARELLEFTVRPIDQVAWSSGYEDAAAFRKIFQKIVGLAPGDYRKRFGVRTAA
jgi:transcriptional regulator GlxA family with amidase domain